MYDQRLHEKLTYPWRTPPSVSAIIDMTLEIAAATERNYKCIVYKIPGCTKICQETTRSHVIEMI